MQDYEVYLEDTVSGQRETLTVRARDNYGAVMAAGNRLMAERQAEVGDYRVLGVDRVHPD